MTQEIRTVGLQRAFLTGAVVFRGPLEALDAALRAVESVPGLRVVYVKTDAGRLKIVAEEGRADARED